MGLEQRAPGSVRDHLRKIVRKTCWLPASSNAHPHVHIHDGIHVRMYIDTNEVTLSSACLSVCPSLSVSLYSSPPGIEEQSSRVDEDIAVLSLQLYKYESYITMSMKVILLDDCVSVLPLKRVSVLPS